MGRNSVAFLNLAAESSNKIADIAKEIKGLVYNEDGENSTPGTASDNWKREVSSQIEETEKVETEGDGKVETETKTEG